MIAPPSPDESERLAELESLAAPDMPGDRSFDDVVALAARICDTPIALISLVDKDRQWFKARYGFDSDQTPLDRSICAHAILEDGLVEIRDTQEDQRTRDNPLCVALDAPIRFYAGAPLLSSAGHKLGMLCVLDTRPRSLDETQRETLRVLAGQVMREFELGRALHRESILRDEIDHRVKNSLQTVMSYIRIYSGQTNETETKEALAAISRRVEAIAQLHSELYNSSAFDTIRLDRYLGRVARLLQGSAGPRVVIETDFEQISTGSRKAANLAMIVSEFCANAIKHAFPGERPGRITLTLWRREDGVICLTCRDDGIGSAAVRHPREPGIVSIGKRLMEAAAEHLGGEMTLTAGEDGYALLLCFEPGDGPDPEPAAEASDLKEAVPSAG